MEIIIALTLILATVAPWLIVNATETYHIVRWVDRRRSS